MWLLLFVVSCVLFVVCFVLTDVCVFCCVVRVAWVVWSVFFSCFCWLPCAVCCGVRGLLLNRCYRSSVATCMLFVVCWLLFVASGLFFVLIVVVWCGVLFVCCASAVVRLLLVVRILCFGV